MQSSSGLLLNCRLLCKRVPSAPNRQLMIDNFEPNGCICSALTFQLDFVVASFSGSAAKAKPAAAGTRQELATQQQRTAELRSRVGNLESMAIRNAKDKHIAAQVGSSEQPALD